MENDNINNNQDLSEKTESLDAISQSASPEPVMEEAVTVSEPTPVVEETVTVSEPTPVVEETVTVSEPTPVVEETVTVSEPTPVVEETVTVSEPTPVAEETATPVAEEVKPAEPAQPVKVKGEKSKLPILLVIILILAGVVFYLLYGDKLFKKEEKPAPVAATVAEYVSLDGKEFLRIKSDDTYELNLTSQSYTDPTKVRDKKGTYTKSGESYTLDNGAIVNINSDYVEVTNIINTTDEKREEILFFQTKLNDVKAKLDAEIKSYVTNEKDEDKAFNVERAQVENVAYEISQCYRMALSGEQINKNNITCQAELKVYLKDYNAESCTNSMNNNVKDGYQFASWAIPNGQCQADHVSRSSFLEIEPNNSYKVISANSSAV